MNHQEPETITFSARLPADLAAELKMLSRRQGLRSGIITKVIVDGVRLKLATMKRTEDAGASQAHEMA